MLHKSEELIKLKRRCAKDILETIKEQDDKSTRKRKTKEEYLTRFLSERGYLQNQQSEIILFDQYPLTKEKATKKVDIIYSFKNIKECWELSLVEAKIENGDCLSKTIEQACEYVNIFQDGEKELRSRCMKELAENRYNVNIGDNPAISRIDILAPIGWWKENESQKDNAKAYLNKNCANLMLRFLSFNDNYLESEHIEIKELK